MSQNYNIAGLGQFLAVDQVANTISINSVSVALSTVNSTSNGVFIGKVKSTVDQYTLEL